MEIKKSDSANIEKTRSTVFLVSLVVILSCVFVALEWHVSLSDRNYDEILNTLEQDLDIQALKEKEEMVAAISADELQEEPTTNVVEKPEEEVKQPLESEQVETTTSELVVNDEEPVVEEAKVQEMPMDLVQEDSKLADEIHYRTIEELPEFPGGHSAFIKWIDDNLKYPDGSRKKKAKGQVVISFIVDSKGAIQDLKLEHGVEREIDLAAMTLFNKMPKWKPGIKDGKPCATMVAVPINFEM